MSWEFSAVSLKVLFCLAVGASIGGLATMAITRQSPSLVKWLAGYTIIGAGVALMTIWLQFAVQIGAFNEDGLSGIFDRDIALMLLDSNVGIGSYYRTVATLLILAAAARCYTRCDLTKSSIGLVVAGSLLLAYSYSVMGHVSELGGLAKFAITLHIIAISWWLGSLVPLQIAQRKLSAQATQQLMERFGLVAQVIIAVLIASGGYLLFELVGSVERMLTTPYGQALSVKLGLVIVMLSLGALNKLRLVPQLTQANGIKNLTRAINIEIMLAIAIISVTAYFTTVIGPGY